MIGHNNNDNNNMMAYRKSKQSVVGAKAISLTEDSRDHLEDKRESNGRRQTAEIDRAASTSTGSNAKKTNNDRWKFVAASFAAVLLVFSFHQNQSCLGNIRQLGDNVPSEDPVPKEPQDAVQSLFQQLSTSTWTDTPGGLLLQIIGINEQRNTPLYSEEDIKLIMNAVAIATFHYSQAVHIAGRSLVQHTLASASCQLMVGASAAEVAFSAMHVFWYTNLWTSRLSQSEICQVRESLVSAIGTEAEELLWYYTHLFTHGQNPVILKQHLESRLKPNLSSELEKKLYRFITCDELEVVKDYDRLWYSDSEVPDLESRLAVMTEMAPLINFPKTMMELLTERSNLIIQMLSGDYGKTIKHHKVLWQKSIPSIHFWQLPPKMKVAWLQTKTPESFMERWDKNLQAIDSFCPANYKNVTTNNRYDLKTLEKDLKEMYRWQSDIGGLWRTEMLYTGRDGKSASSTKQSLKDLYIDRVSNIVRISK